MSEDFPRDYEINVAYNRALLEIEDVLITHNLNCEAFGLPIPVQLPDGPIDDFDPIEEDMIFTDLYSNANLEQKDIIDRVIREVQFHDTGRMCFV